MEIKYGKNENVLKTLSDWLAGYPFNMPSQILKMQDFFNKGYCFQFLFLKVEGE